jgi:SPP1 family phage portal protein
MTAVSRAYDWLKDGNEITGKLIGDIVFENRTRHHHQITLYERFKGTKEGLPILRRTFPIENTSKINSQLANDFFSDIINTKIGYFMGNPVSYKLTKKDANGDSAQSDDLDNLLDGFIKKNSIADLDAETAKMAAICGNGARLCYVDEDGDAAIINVPSWECVFICDEIGVTDSDYAIRYYEVTRDDQKFIRAEFYDRLTVSFWILEATGSNANTEFSPDPTEEAIPHMMDSCPLLCFPNNEEMIGDADKVLSLIDGYDRALSDINSEIEQFRLAYLIFYGMAPDDETLKKLRQTGILSIPDVNSKSEYLIKNLNDAVVENHLNRLDENIMYFAQTVRFTDETFGQASGVAMKFKLFNLESKCKIAERKFIKALYRQFESLAGYFSKRGITYDPWSIDFIFTRNFPLNLLDSAQSLATLNGLVSTETALSQMPFIDDPQKEMEKMKAEQEDYNAAQAELMAAYAQEEQNGTTQTETMQISGAST